MADAVENSIWKQQIRSAAMQDTLSHAMILCGPGDLTEAALYTAAAHLCTGETRPCLRCNSCRKVMQRIHPDVTPVQDPEHKYISVDVIRRIRSEAYIRPNEGTRRVFIFPDCDLLTEQDQNVLLKLIEEGPAYAAFLFCTETAGSLLPTVRSRCVQCRISGADDCREPDPMAQELCHAAARRKALSLARLFTAWEGKKLKREQLQATLQDAAEITAQALLAQYGKTDTLCETAKEMSAGLDAKALVRLSGIWEKAARDCEYNVGVGLTLGAMLSDIEEVIR